ncbi:3-phytase [Halopseudomonas litoralis]|uniref:3-phytase n=1 Tax=Halopseudomonas litoralis TaxID=797277 RepID=A0A1H1XIB7_9GAMM|nr:phytase [Halopseudomonas litoralis]SDT08446.1 3-phytase [Halopseudomonas litoralis]
MYHRFRLTPLAALALSGLLTACSGAADQPSAYSERSVQNAALQAWSPAHAQSAESWLLLNNGQRLAANADGLWLLDARGQKRAQHSGNFSALDARMLGEQLLIATTETALQQPTLLQADADSLTVRRKLVLPSSDYRIENLCLYRDDASNLHLFIIGEEGKGDQWLVGSASQLLEQAAHVRSLGLPPEAEHCAVDEQQHLLYVNEESVGIWAYGAHPEAELGRQPVDMLAPFGGLQELVAGLTVIPGGLMALDADARQLHSYRLTAEGWEALAPLVLDGTVEPERLTARAVDGQAELLIVDGDDGRLYQSRIDWPHKTLNSNESMPMVQPLAQTESVPSVGDAADDPAIWLHPTDPAQSRVLGTDKRNGLAVYDLQGQQLQYLHAGRLNNVDVRSGFQLGEQQLDLAVASNRDHNSLQLFGIDPVAGGLRDLGQIATPLDEIYGLCMGQAADGRIYAIANDKDGRFLQYRLDGRSGEARGELVREFSVATQPEGCVVDDQRQHLFIGEEGEAVWALDAGEDASTEMTRVINVDGPVEADIEGLALYQHPEHPYLVISSQGNDSYVVTDAEPPFALRGSFRIGLNAELGIDGVSETDGLEVTSANLGGPWSAGMLMVQDGRKRMPEGNQNYKYVPWQSIADALQLD